MAETLFWFAALALFYGFVGYPLILKALVAFRTRRERWEDADEPPSVAMLLSVLNEEDVIADKIRNFRELDYPAEKLELIIVSDGCTDRTEDVVEELRDERVRLLVQERNMGKTLALNRAVAESEADIVVFTDADSMFDRDALMHLVAPFADSSVGLVSGHTEYRAEGSGGGAYRRYEDAVKVLESDLWGIVGADGAVYAMRRELYEPIVPEYINDLLHPIQVVMRGYDALQEQAAVCREPLEEAGPGGFHRQTRIMTQSWLIVLSQLPGLVRAGKWGFLWQMLSHKVVRWLTLPLLGIVLLANLFLVGQGGFYVPALLAQLGFYACAYAYRHEQGGMKLIPYTFLLLHLSAAIGLFKHMKGETYVSWKPRNN